MAPVIPPNKSVLISVIAGSVEFIRSQSISKSTNVYNLSEIIPSFLPQLDTTPFKSFNSKLANLAICLMSSIESWLFFIF